MVLPIVPNPPTLLKKEFIHLVKVFFCVASRSSCSCLIRPFSKPCSTRAAIVKQEQRRPLVSLQITLKLHWVPYLSRLSKRQRGVIRSGWSHVRLHVGVYCAVVYVMLQTGRLYDYSYIAKLPPNAPSRCLLKSWHIQGH